AHSRDAVALDSAETNPALGHRQRPVIVAMAAVRVMQVAVDQVVDVRAVRHDRMATPGPVAMSFLVSVTVVVRRAFGAIRRRFAYRVLADRALLRMMQVTVV